MTETVVEPPEHPALASARAMAAELADRSRRRSPATEVGKVLAEYVLAHVPDESRASVASLLQVADAVAHAPASKTILRRFGRLLCKAADAQLGAPLFTELAAALKPVLS